MFELLLATQAVGKTAVAFRPDPGLGRQLNLLGIMFEQMPMGIAVLERNFCFQRYNPTWDDFSARYAPPSSAPLAPGVCYFDHLPGTESIVHPMFERVLAGETVQQNDVRLELAGIVSIDTTERASLRQNLEQRVSARTQELQTRLDVSATANSSLDLDKLLTRALNLLVDLVGASRAGVSLLDEKSGKLQPGILRPERAVDPAEMAVMIQAAQAVSGSGKMMYVAPDATQDLLEPGVLLPLQIRDRKLDVLAIIGAAGGSFTPNQLTLFKSIAEQLNVAIENAYLFEHAEAAAVAAERNRLARELTRGALAEMGTLLLELRPATLTESSLAELLRQLTQAVGGRSRLPTLDDLR